MGVGDDYSSDTADLSAGSSESTATTKGTSANSTATAIAIDANKGIPDASLPSAMEANKGTPDVDASLPSAMEADKGTPHVDASLPSAMEADKGTTAKVLLATDVEAGKGTTAKESPRSDVDPSKGTNTKESLADNIDGSTGELLTAATAAPSPPIPEVAVPLPLPKFIEKAKVLIEQKDWQGLDKQLCQFVDDNTEKKPQDPGMLHPGLVIFAREQRVIQLLEGEEFDVATTYADEFLKPLKTCQSKFKPLNLESCINDIIRMIDNRSVSSTKSIGDVDVETAISDYFLLYFRTMCQDEADHEAEGTWQFAKKLKGLDKETSPSGKVQRHRQAFSCLACGWTMRGSASISSLRYHIARSTKKKVHPCPKVTQDMLDRLKLTMLDDPDSVPSFSDFVESIKKRKGSSSLSAAAQSMQPLAVAPVKKLRSSSSNTVASSPPAACPEANPSSRGVDSRYLLEKVDKLQKISTFMFANIDSVAPSVRPEYVQKARELEKVAYDLKMKTAEDESAPPPVQMPPQTQEEASG